VVLGLALKVAVVRAVEHGHGPAQVLCRCPVVEVQPTRAPDDLDSILGQRDPVAVDPLVRILGNKDVVLPFGDGRTQKLPP
jgi:hypothetical protein